MKSNFAENIKKIRKDNNLSQEQLADKLGVSRQSISKWESQVAYPEMDKVIQICRMFNLNVDELLNQNISEVQEHKEEKVKVNKYIDSFLLYITKAVKMFSIMKFKSKLKCLFEQILIIIFLVIIFSIIGTFLFIGIDHILNLLPSEIYEFLYNTFQGIYLIFCLIIGLIIIFHIFKTRYLDYFQFASYNTKEDTENISTKNINTILENKEKIIIRDSKNTEYSFMKALIKIFIIMLKCLLGLIFLLLSITLIFFIFTFITSCYHVIYHNIFIGISLLLLSFTIINILILLFIYNFILNKKVKIKKTFTIFIISLVLSGMGSAWCLISSLNINYNNEKYIYKNKDTIIKEYELNSETNIYSYHNSYTFEIDNSKINTVEIKVKYNKLLSKINITNDSNSITLDYNSSYNNFTNVYKRIMHDLKNNSVYNYDNIEPEFVIVTSEDNIKRIINNKTKNRLSDLDIVGNRYYLTLNDFYEGDKNICYLENDYYNNCINISSNVSENDFIYDGDGLHYDNTKYTCNKFGKYYDCEDLTA